ncbi:MAG: hypothetical protein FGM37_10175, partial [Phycisphaerales bacterium]|nr:hypothetical protein [Phycisphaerales bacterium]
FCWVQEETRNSGAFRYVQAQMIDRFGVNPRYIGRPDCASPATGSALMHERMAKALGAMVFPALDPRAKPAPAMPVAEAKPAGRGRRGKAEKDSAGASEAADAGTDSGPDAAAAPAPSAADDGDAPDLFASRPSRSRG